MREEECKCLKCLSLSQGDKDDVMRQLNCQEWGSQNKRIKIDF